MMSTLANKVKTKVIKSNLNPVWNEELMLSVPSPPHPLKVGEYLHRGLQCKLDSCMPK
ncbi:hypothetical protein O6H91_08G034100 [Diphasiastrum complanatum]|uniref:Uncharacterized protein n=1 Tax=Diphasiastrum complanatum TaxID=34168 RepID=A0ACC2CWA1_DIPCM|nr:hypothetical protein O6H91_08G034100 [Diphasiastrum complanatum]